MKRNYDGDSLYDQNTIEGFSVTHDCSKEITEAIFEYRSTYGGRERVWESPTQREEKKITTRAWEIAGNDTDELYWGGTITRE